MESWEVGYTNRNHQVNLGWIDRMGQSCYRMHCLACGQTYGTIRGMGARWCPNPDCDFGGGQDGPRLTPEERPATVDGRRRQAIELLASTP